MDGVLERPAQYSVYAEEDGKVDTRDDEREGLGSVVDEVEAVKVTVFEYSGDEERPGNQYGENARGNLHPLRGAHHQQMYQGNKRAGDYRHHEEDTAEHKHGNNVLIQCGIGCESPNVLRKGAVRVINDKDEDIA